MFRSPTVRGWGLWLCAVLAAAVPVTADAVIIRQDDLAYTVKRKGPAAELYLAGVAALAEGKPEAAERSFQEAMRADPAAFEPLIGMAEVELARQQPKAAWTWLERAAKLAPRSAAVQDAIGRYHFAQRDYAAAEAALRKAQALEPDNVLVNLDLGDLLLNARKQPVEAEAAYRRALRTAPNHPGAYNGLGMALAAQGKYPDAIAALQRSIALAPDNPLPRLSLARTLQASQDWPGALAAYDAVLKLQPGLVPALLGRADVLAARGDAKGALAAYELAVKTAPTVDETHLRLGMALQGMGRTDEAERAYREAVRLNPSQALAYNNLAWMAAERRRNLGEARGWAEKAVSLAPAEPLFLDTLAWVQRAEGKPAEAVATLTRASKMKGAGPEIWYHLGVIHEEQQRRAEAQQAYRKALSLDPRFSPAEQALKTLGQP